jgi:hypothetical protein
MQEFRVALATLDGAFQKVMPWNMSFKTLYTFMVSINFGESDLSSKTNKLVILANFVDEVLRANARNWEEKKSFLSFQDLAVRWTTSSARRLGVGSGSTETTSKKAGKSKGQPGEN